jgi:signal peptidase I
MMTPTADTSAAEPKSLTRNLLEWSALILLAFVVARVITTFIIQPFIVPTGSMIPTVQPNDRLIVAKYAYSIGDAQRGDVIVFRNWDPNGPDLLKRVIGLPGETVGMDPAGRFTIDGKPLPEPYLADEARHTVAGTVPLPYTLKAGEYWVMGDNRNNSGDSRYNGPIQRSQLVGKGLFIFWPLGDAKGL